MSLLAQHNMEQILQINLAPYKVDAETIKKIVSQLQAYVAPKELNQYRVHYRDENKEDQEKCVFSADETKAWIDFSLLYPACSISKIVPVE